MWADAGGCGRMGAPNLSKNHFTFAPAPGALGKRVGVRVWVLCVDLHRSRLGYAPPLQVHLTPLLNYDDNSISFGRLTSK